MPLGATIALTVGGPVLLGGGGAWLDIRWQRRKARRRPTTLSRRAAVADAQCPRGPEAADVLAGTAAWSPSPATTAAMQEWRAMEQGSAGILRIPADLPTSPGVELARMIVAAEVAALELRRKANDAHVRRRPRPPVVVGPRAARAARAYLASLP